MCHFCGQASPAAARFCVECGTALAREQVQLIKGEFGEGAKVTPPVTTVQPGSPQTSRLKSTLRTTTSAASAASAIPNATAVAASTSALFAPPSPTATTAAPIATPVPIGVPPKAATPIAIAEAPPAASIYLAAGAGGIPLPPSTVAAPRLEVAPFQPPTDPDVNTNADVVSLPVGDLISLLGRVGFTHTSTDGRTARLEASLGMVLLDAEPDRTKVTWFAHDPARLEGVLGWFRHEVDGHLLTASQAAVAAESLPSTVALPWVAADPVDLTAPPVAPPPALPSSSPEMPPGTANLKRIFELSEQCLPAFARIGRKQPAAAGNYDPLGVSWAEKNFPIPNRPAEEVVCRFSVIAATIAVGTDENDFPINAPDHTGVTGSVNICEGAGLAILTNERLVGMLFLGTTAFGPLDETSNIVFSVDLHEVGSVMTLRRKTVLGTREVGLMITTRGSGLITLDIDRRIDEDRFAHRISYAELMKSFVETTIARLRIAGKGDLALLAEAEAGHFDPLDEHLVASFYR